MHFQQAVQAEAFNWTNAVCVLSFCINVDFMRSCFFCKLLLKMEETIH